MKKVLLSISLLLALNTTYSQSRKVVVDKCINKSEIHGPSGVICSNIRRTKWFTLTPVYKLDGNRLSCDELIVIRTGIGDLSKEDQLFFSFNDGTKLRLESGGVLNSDNIVYFKDTILLQPFEMDSNFIGVKDDVYGLFIYSETRRGNKQQEGSPIKRSVKHR